MLFKSQLDGPLSLKKKKTKEKKRREGRNRACAFLEEFRRGGCFADEKVLARTPSRKASSAAARPAKMAALGLALLARQGPTGEGRRPVMFPQECWWRSGAGNAPEPAAKQTNSLSFCFFVFFLGILQKCIQVSVLLDSLARFSP